MTSNGQRLKKLRDLLDRIERLPASAERERMLREVRARVVDVDTGVVPRAMLPTDAESSQPPAAPLARVPRPITAQPAVQPRPPVPAPRPVAAPPPVDASPLAPGELLSLDDPAPVMPRPARTAVPWARGLRG